MPSVVHAAASQAASEFSVLDLPVRPPHAPDDLALVGKLIGSLEDGEDLPPVVVFRQADHYQAVTGSHRLAAWAELDERHGCDLRRLLVLTDEEVAEALACMPWLPQTIAEAWPKLTRAGDFASQLHWCATRADVKAALAGQW